MLKPLDKRYCLSFERGFQRVIKVMQDNDPKHTSLKAQQFMIVNRIYWLKMPAESPDISAIKNLWHELKKYIRMSWCVAASGADVPSDPDTGE